MKHIKSFVAMFSALALMGSMMVSCSGSSKDSDSKKKSQNERIIEAQEVGDEADAESGATWQEGLPSVIDFYATWCGPCKNIAPLVEQLEGKYRGKINFSRIDVDQDAEMAEKYHIEAMPTFVFLDAEGNEISRIVGADSDALVKKVKELAQ